MTTRNLSVEPAVSASGEVDTLLIERMTGRIKEASLKAENLMNHFDVQDVTSTDRVGEKFMGDTELEVLAPGQAPNGSPMEFDKNTLVVDTVVIGRNYTRLLSDVQNDINGLHSRIANQQTMQHKKLEDQMLIQQMLYGAGINFKANGAFSNSGAGVAGSTGRTAPRVSGHGYSQCFTLDEAKLVYPEYLTAALEAMLEVMLDGRDGGDGVDVSGMSIAMPWKYFNVLRDAERIVASQYNTFQGTTVEGFVLKSFNIPVVPSNRFPTSTKRHKLSKDSNGNRYDATAEMLKAVFVIFNADALLVGKSIELTGDIWFDKDTKSWVVDSWQSEGAIPSIWESVGAAFAGADAGMNSALKADLAGRAARKATPQRAPMATS